MSLHRIDLDRPGTFLGARVVCLGTDADECHQWCAEGCEELCYGYHADKPHRWEPIGSCRVAEWIDACGIEDTCADDDVLIFDEEGESQPLVRSGFIETEWTGDDYVWRYAEPPAAGDPS